LTDTHVVQASGSSSSPTLPPKQAGQLGGNQGAEGDHDNMQQDDLIIKEPHVSMVLHPSDQSDSSINMKHNVQGQQNLNLNLVPFMENQQNGNGPAFFDFLQVG
jgi:hypothetical protein